MIAAFFPVFVDTSARLFAPGELLPLISSEKLSYDVQWLWEVVNRVVQDQHSPGFRLDLGYVERDILKGLRVQTTSLASPAVPNSLRELQSCWYSDCAVYFSNDDKTPLKNTLFVHTDGRVLHVKFPSRHYMEIGYGFSGKAVHYVRFDAPAPSQPASWLGALLGHDTSRAPAQPRAVSFFAKEDIHRSHLPGDPLPRLSERLQRFFLPQGERGNPWDIEIVPPKRLQDIVTPRVRRKAEVCFVGDYVRIHYSFFYGIGEVCYGERGLPLGLKAFLGRNTLDALEAKTTSVLTGPWKRSNVSAENAAPVPGNPASSKLAR